jgi:Putative adhesin
MGRLTDRFDRIDRWGQRVLDGRVVRVLWLAGASLIAVPMLVFGTYEVASAIAHEERTVSDSVPAAGLTGVDVEGSTGSVHVIGVEDSNTVNVRSRVSDGLRPTGYRTFVRDGRLVVRSTCPVYGSSWCSVSSTIEMPSDLGLSIQADGGVEVSDVHGGVSAHADGGSVTATRVSGTLDLSSDQGRVEASGIDADHVVATSDQGRVDLTFTNSPRSVEARSDQGSVTVVLPEEPGVVYATTLETDQGSAQSLIVQDHRSDRTIIATSDQGDVTVSYATG